MPDFADLPDQFLPCREISHQWVPLSASWDDEARIYLRSLRCRICHTRKHQRLLPDGHIASSKMEYPDGYLVKGQGRMRTWQRDELRLRLVNRQIGTK